MSVAPILLFYSLLVPTTALFLTLNPAQALPTQSSDTPQLQLPAPSSSPIAHLPSNLSGLSIQCDAAKYGHDLRYGSCYDAYDHIPHLMSTTSFGPRTQGNWDVRLPFRIFSSDGLCAIDIGTRSGYAISDKASWYNIAQAAYEILHECVEPTSSGGSLKNLGLKNNLIISMLSYTPHVRCVPPRAGHPPPNITLCDEISDGMPATTNVRVFGPEGEEGVQVKTPQSLNLISPEGSCEMVINTRGPLDRVAWFDLYVVMRAVSAICVESGEGGISTGQGLLGNLFVIVKGGSQ